MTDGSSTHAVLGADHAISLALPPGSSATSPEMCVDLNYPTFRFFATQLEQDTDAELAVDVIYPALAKDNVRQAKKFRLKAKDGWELSDDIKLEPQRLGKPSGWRKIAIRFRVKPGNKPATYKIDDVLIDPRRSTDPCSARPLGRALQAAHGRCEVDPREELAFCGDRRRTAPELTPFERALPFPCI